MRKLGLSILPVLILGSVLIIGCGGGHTASQTPGGTVVVMGTDFPTLSNVISFVVPISNITLSGNGSTNVSVMNAPTSIDFSELVGLRSVIDVQPATPGTYTSATITLGSNPTLSILDTTVSPPKVTTFPASFSTTSITVNLPSEDGDDHEDVTPQTTLGMILHFHLDKSIPVDSSGNIVETGGTVMVTPVITLRFLHADRDHFDVDELRGGVVSVGSNGSFVIETKNRVQMTVSTDSNTKFEPSGQSFSTLSPNDLVEIEDGTLDPSTLMVQAKEVEVFSDQFVVAGLVTTDSPAATSGSTTCASSLSLLVRDVLPAGASSLTEDQISSVALAGTEKYFFVHEDDDILSGLSNLTFNSCSLVPGQALTIGGSINGSTLTAARVMLAKQGFSGTAASSVNNGTFTFNAQGLAGTLLPSPVTVVTLMGGDFNTQFQPLDFGVSTGSQLRVAALVLFNTSTNSTNLLALRLVQPDQD